MKNYFAHVWRQRFFVFMLTKFEVRARYRGHLIGLGWIVLFPLLQTAVLCLLFHRVFQTDAREYAPFLLAGLVCWQFISSSLIQGAQCFLSAESYLRQQPVPLLIYPLRTTLALLLYFSVALTLAVGVRWCLLGFDNLPVLWALLPAAVLLFVLGISAATVAGVVNVYSRDTRQLLEVGMPLLFYLTPVMYQARLLRGSRLGWLIDHNPLNVVLDLFRVPIVDGALPSPTTYGLAALTAFAAAGVAGWLLARVQQRLVFAV